MLKRMTKITDWLGRAVKRAQVVADQSSRIGLVGTEFEHHPSRGLTPARLATLLSAAEQGDLVGQLDLYEDMEEKDAHIFTELSKRKRVLQGLDWRIAPPRNASAQEERASEQVREWFEAIDNFEDIIFDMADAIGKGFSCQEIEWVREERYLLPRLSWRPARWFSVDPRQRDNLLLRTADGQGEALWPFKWVAHIHKAKSGYLARSGLLRVLAWPYLFKNYSVRDLAEFLEIYGIPVRLGTYPSGASEKDKLTLLRAVTSIGHNAAGIMPEGMLMEFKEAAKGASDPFMAMIQWCEASQSKAILGGTLTTSAQSTGLGSNLGEVHNEVRHDLRDSDARQIAGTLTRDLVWPMVALNIPGIAPHRSPRFEFDTQEGEDLAQYAEAIPKLVEAGAKIPVRWLHERLHIPEPQEGEPVLGFAAPNAAPATAQVAAARRSEPGVNRALDKQASDEIDTLGRYDAHAGEGRGEGAAFAEHGQMPGEAELDGLIDSLDAETLDAQGRALLAPIVRLAEEAPDQLLGRLAECYPQMDDQDLQETLARILFVAEIWGRLNAQAEG